MELVLAEKAALFRWMAGPRVDESEPLVKEERAILRERQRTVCDTTMMNKQMSADSMSALKMTYQLAFSPNVPTSSSLPSPSSLSIATKIMGHFVLD